MLRWIGRILFISLLVVHLAVLVLWWDSWRCLRYYIGPQERAGIYSGFGMLIVNIRGTAVFGVDPRDVRDSQLLSIPMKAWTDAEPDRNLYLEPLTVGDERTELKTWFSAEVVRRRVYTPTPYHAPATQPPTYIGMDRYLRLHFPHWFAAAVSGMLVYPWLGFIAFRRRRARRRDRAGLCPKCGYDLRANPARCSECGHASQAVSVPVR